MTSSSKIVFACAMSALLVGVGQAKAEILLEFVNAPVQFEADYSLDFIAPADTTQIEIAGYQVGSNESALDISLRALGGGPNLLAQNWVYTPAPIHPMAGQFNDGFGSGTNGLNFASGTVGSFDRFDQLVSTTTGQIYRLNFLFNQNSQGPSDFVVSGASAPAPAPVPEPSSLALLGLGATALAVAAYRRRKDV